MSELFKKDEKEFRYWLVNRRQMFDKEENLIENYNRIYLKLACCIRDWKVLIDRDATMNYVGSRIPPGVKSDKKRQISDNFNAITIDHSESSIDITLNKLLEIK